jgi:hypothetical protein
MCLMRVLVGKLYEAYRTIDKYYLKKGGLREEIEARFDEETMEALRNFVEYFSEPRNHLNVLRNKIAFHNDFEFAMQNLRSIPDDCHLFIYTDETDGNTLFHFADLGAAFIMSNHVKPGDFMAGLDEVTDEAIRLARNLMDFSTACLGILISLRISFAQDQVELRSAPKLGDVRIPFFMLPVQPSDAATPTADQTP